MRGVAILIAYGMAIVSAALASFYGFTSASGNYGIIKGVALCCIAFLGVHGPAWAASLWREKKRAAALFAWMVTAFCFGVSLLGGLGTIASGGAQLQAESSKIAGDTKRAKVNLERVTAERAAMTFTATDAATVAAAETAVKAAERVRSSECERRWNTCRQRENEESARRNELSQALKNKALTDQAAKLDTEIMRLSAMLDNAPAVKVADPQASTFSQLTGIPVDTSAALYAVTFSLALELGAALAMMMAYNSPKAVASQAQPPLQPPAPRQELIEPERASPQLVISNPAPVSIIKFVGTTLTREEGAEIEFDELYMAYWQYCKQLNGRPIDPRAAVEMVNEFCAECDIPIEARGALRYLIGVKLKDARSAVTKPRRIAKKA